MKKRTLLSWSSGKDSAWALHVLRQDPNIDVLGLFSVMNQKYREVWRLKTPAPLIGAVIPGLHAGRTQNTHHEILSYDSLDHPVFAAPLI
jgi:hypothetical protein